MFLHELYGATGFSWIRAGCTCFAHGSEQPRRFLCAVDHPHRRLAHTRCGTCLLSWSAATRDWMLWYAPSAAQADRARLMQLWPCASLEVQCAIMSSTAHGKRLGLLAGPDAHHRHPAQYPRQCALARRGGSHEWRVGPQLVRLNLLKTMHMRSRYHRHTPLRCALCAAQYAPR